MTILDTEEADCTRRFFILQIADKILIVDMNSSLLSVGLRVINEQKVQGAQKQKDHFLR